MKVNFTNKIYISQNQEDSSAILFLQVGPVSNGSGDFYADEECTLSLFDKNSKSNGNNFTDLNTSWGPNTSHPDGTRTLVFRGKDETGNLFSYNKTISIYSKKGETIKSCVAWMILDSLPEEVIKNCSQGPTPGVSKIEFTIEEKDVSYDISFVDGISHGVEMSFIRDYYNLSSVPSGVRKALPNISPNVYITTKPSSYDPVTYTNKMPVLLSDKYTASDTIPSSPDDFGILLSDRILLAGANNSSNGYDKDIPIYINASRRVGYKYINDDSLLLLPNQCTSFCGWAKKLNLEAYCWGFDEIECLEETCGYSSEDPIGGPDPKIDIAARNFLHQKMPNFASLYSCGANRMLKNGISDSPNYGNYDNIIHPDSDCWWVNGAPIPPDQDAKNTWLKRSSVLVKENLSLGDDLKDSLNCIFYELPWLTQHYGDSGGNENNASEWVIPKFSKSVKTPIKINTRRRKSISKTLKESLPFIILFLSVLFFFICLILFKKEYNWKKKKNKMAKNNL
jgi:hypothetical protein